MKLRKRGETTEKIFFLGFQTVLFYNNIEMGASYGKTEAKLKAQELIMTAISMVKYHLADSELSEEQKKLVDVEIHKQADRIAKSFGYDKAWFN